MLRFGALQKFERRVLAESLDVSLFVTHLVQIVYGSHFENLNIASVLKACVRATSVDELTISFGVALEVVFELKLVVLLLMVAEVGFIWWLDLSATICANQHLRNFFSILWR